MRTKVSAISLIVLSSALALLISGPAQARTSKVDVVTFFLPDEVTLAAGDVVGKATLKRSEEGVNLRLHTTNLGPGYAYTVWWVIFNNPEACTDAGCGLDDADFVNPEVDAAIMSATGRVADDNGNAWFSAFLPVGFIHTNPSSGNLRQLSGAGLHHPMGAEIHVVVRCHGPWVGPFIDTEQLTTYLGDCNNPDSPITGCYDAHLGVFLPPRGRHGVYSDFD